MTFLILYVTGCSCAAFNESFNRFDNEDVQHVKEAGLFNVADICEDALNVADFCLGKAGKGFSQDDTIESKVIRDVFSSIVVKEQI